MGKTGLRVSVIGVGTWQLGGEWGKEFSQGEVDAMLARAAERGINLIDTAECYGDHQAKKLVGQAIKGEREKWIIATKVGAEAAQIVYNRIEREAERQMLPSCLRQGLGVLARVPLASGFLSGKYTQDSQFSSTDVRAVWQSVQERRSLIEQTEHISRREVPQGVPLAQWALAWCLQHPAVSCVIPGCKSLEQVESNAQAADLPDITNDHPQATE